MFTFAEAADEHDRALMRAWQELREASDRASIIVGCALLDEMLRRAICLRLAPEPGTIKAVFEDGMLETFEAKVQLAFLLGIFQKATRDNLRTLGSLRNKFAHKPEIDSFDDHGIGAQIMGLDLAKRVHRADDIFGRSNPGAIHKDATKRERVIFVIGRLMYYFAIDAFQPRRTPEPAPF
jgi:hypothetical protein